MARNPSEGNNLKSLRYKSSAVIVLPSQKSHGCKETALILKISNVPFLAFSNIVYAISINEGSTVYVRNYRPL